MSGFYPGGECRGVEDALGEFVAKWVEGDLLRQLGDNPESITDATLLTLLESSGQKLRVLVEKVSELALHFVNLE